MPISLGQMLSTRANHFALSQAILTPHLLLMYEIALMLKLLFNPDNLTAVFKNLLQRNFDIYKRLRQIQHRQAASATNEL